MILGFVSDIHGNYEALSKCIDQSKKLGVNKIICLGDSVGYYYEPEKCIDLLLKNNIESVLGNHEEMLLYLIRFPEKIDYYVRKYGHGIKFALENLKDDHLNYIKNLKGTLKLNINNLNFLIAHGSPWDVNCYVYKNSDKSIFERLNNYKYDYVVLGHTHIQMIKKLKNTTIFNPGSIGQPRDNSKKANWVIFNTENENLKFMQTDFDGKKIIDQVNLNDNDKLYLKKYF